MLHPLMWSFCVFWAKQVDHDSMRRVERFWSYRDAAFSDPEFARFAPLESPEAPGKGVQIWINLVGWDRGFWHMLYDNFSPTSKFGKE